MIIVTGFNAINVAEGVRVGFTYSEVSDGGTITRQNAKGNFIVRDEELGRSIEGIKKYIKNTLESATTQQGM